MDNNRLNRRRLPGWLGLAPAAALAARGAAATAALERRAPVRLLFTRVNGEHYYDAAAAVTMLTPGDRVTLRREPDNPYDRRAIEVIDAAGQKLGYVARIDNSALARMIDAGERFEARIARLDRRLLDIRLEIDWLRA